MAKDSSDLGWRTGGSLSPVAAPAVFGRVVYMFVPRFAPKSYSGRGSVLLLDAGQQPQVQLDARPHGGCQGG